MTVNNGGGGGGAGGPSVAFASVTPSGGDDTAAIQAAVNSAVAAGQANGSNYGEVWFGAGVYNLGGAPGGHGAPFFGNSQVNLPVIASGVAAAKFTLALRGPSSGGTALPHWNQTVGQKSGAVLRTTATGTNDGTYGPASVIGGPTALQGYGGGSGNAWSNILIVVDGLTIASATANPTMCGFNFEGILEAKVRRGSYVCDVSPATMAALITGPPPGGFTNQWAYGLAMPTTNNNDLCIVDDWSCEGAYIGLQISEHAHVRDMRSIYCNWGVLLDNRTATPHWSQIDFASVEICNAMMGLATNNVYKLNADRIDTEGSFASTIWDGNSNIVGSIGVGSNSTSAKFDWTGAGLGNWIGNWATTPTNGHNMRITNSDVLPGAPANQPTVPAASTLFYNKSMRDGAVTLTGGTAMNVSIDGGPAQGNYDSTFIVPAGKAINLGAYTVAPTWMWILL